MYSSEERLVNKPVFLRDHELGRKGSNIRTKICEKTFELQGMDFPLSLFTYGGDVIEMIIQNDEVSFFLHIKNDYLNYSDDNKSNEEILSLRFNYAKILELFKKIVACSEHGSDISELRCFGKHPLFEHEFIFLKSSSKNTSTTKHIDSGNRKRRRVDTKKFTHHDSKLGLRIKIIPQPDFLLEPASFHFEFITVPKLDIDLLPNEILLEIFRFMDSKFLVLDVSFVNKKFHQLIDSEFLYRHHHLKCLLSGLESLFPEKKTNSMTWKEYTIKMLHETTICFVLKHPSGDVRDKKNLKEIRSKKASTVIKCLVSARTIPTNIYVSPKECHTWVLKMSGEIFPKDPFEFGSAVGFSREKDATEMVDSYYERILGKDDNYAFDIRNYLWWYMDDPKVHDGVAGNFEVLEAVKPKELLLEISLDGGKMKIVVIEIDGEKPAVKISSDIGEMEKRDLETKFSLAVDCQKDADMEIISFKKNPPEEENKN